MAPALIEASATGPKSTKNKNWILGINNNLSSSNFDRTPLKFDRVVEKTACVFSLGDANRATKSQLNQLGSAKELFVSKESYENEPKEVNCGMEHASSKDEVADMMSTPSEPRVPTMRPSESCQQETIATLSSSVPPLDSCLPNDNQDHKQPIALRDTVLFSLKRRKDLSIGNYSKLRRRASQLDSKLRRMQFNLVASHVDQSKKQLRDLLQNDIIVSKASDSCSVEPVDGDSGQQQRATEGRHNLRRSRSSSSGITRDNASSQISLAAKKQAKQACNVASSHVDVLFHLSELDETDVESGDEEANESGMAAAIRPTALASPQLSTVSESASLSSSGAVCRETAWLTDRAAAGSKCRWLEAQIADLDTKMRIYDNLNRQLMASHQGCKFQTFIPTPDNCGIKTVLDKDVEGFITILPAKDGLSKRSVSNSQVNGIVHCSTLERGSTSRMDVSATKGTAEETSSCARACRLIQRSRHRYINVLKSSSGSSSGNVAVHEALLDEHCGATLLGCHMCDKGRKIARRQLTGSKNRLDSGFHWKLSWNCDVLLPGHLEKLLRSSEVNCDLKPKAHKQSMKRCIEKRKLGPGPIRPSKLNCLSNDKLLQGLERKKTPMNHGLHSSYPGAASNGRNNKIKLSAPDVLKKRAVSVSAAAQLQKRAHRLSASLNESSEMKHPSSSTLESPIATSPQTALPSPAAALRKKRGSSAFDINNIVIPYSMAAATRVEKLKYKEILTPEWREVEDSTCPKKPKIEAAGEESSNNNSELTQESFDEDISYAAFAMRHAACEVEERRRFSRFFQPVRKLKSQKNSECNTPEPHSPSSDDSPRHSAASTPTLDSSGNGFPPKPRFQRASSLFFPTPSLELVEETVTPWPKLVFPMSDNDFQKLRVEAPLKRTRSHDDELVKSDGVTVNHGKQANHVLMTKSPDHTDPSPVASSPSCTSDNSPTNSEENWTVKLVGNEKPVDNDPTHCRKGIVLKLAKK